MSQVIKGRDNYVSITFGGVDLTAFTKVEAKLGSDTRDSTLNPESVVVESATELRLFFGDTTETGGHYWEIAGFDVENPNGLELTSKCLGNLNKTQVCEG